MITQGGTYSGTWYNSDPSLSAVEIRTAEAVVIENSTITSRGNLITNFANDANVTIRNCYMEGLNPNVAGQHHGRAFDGNNMMDIDYFVMEHCHLVRTSGIRIRDIMDKSDPLNGYIKYNKVDVIEGRWSDGNGGYRYQDLQASDSRQFVVFRRVYANNFLIEWNEIINQERDANGMPDGYPAGMQEDVMNFNAGGFTARRNLIVGSYPYNAYTDDHSGTAMISDPAGEYCEDLLFEGNYVINVCNAGISIHNGQDNIWVRDNVVIMSGKDASGNLYDYVSVGLSYQFNTVPNSGFENNLAGCINTRPSGDTQTRKDWNFSQDPSMGDLNDHLEPTDWLFDWNTELQYINEYYNLASQAGIQFGLTSGNQSPSVSITNPSDGANFNVGATVTITADASDNDGSISKVEFFEGTNKLGEDTGSPYSYDWQNVSSGVYNLTAKATDNEGAITESAAISISVGNTPPSVSITSPTDGQTFDAGSTVSITADASDSDGSVNKVEFYQGTTKLGEDLTSPYSYDWTNVSIGTYDLTAKATDDDNEVTTSSIVQINVVDGTTENFSTTDDAYTREHPNGQDVNYGIYDNLECKEQDGYSQYIYLKFDISSAGSSIQSATLKLYGSSSSGDQSTSVYDVTDNSWDETTITWNNQPTASSTASDNQTVTTTAQYYEWDLTSLISDKKNAGLNTVSLMVQNNTSTKVNFNARENTSNQPELVVTSGGGTSNQAPAVSITNPADGASYTEGETVSITADASDSDGTISKVEFYEGTNKLGEDTDSPYSYDWANVSAGSYSITAKAIDDDAAETTSSAIGITVNTPSNQAPTVSITNPADGASYTEGETVSITADASDSDGTISKVEFYEGTNKLGEDTDSPYSYDWTNVAAGSYSLTAKAIDDDAAETTSAIVSIQVNTASVADSIVLEAENYDAQSGVSNGGNVIGSCDDGDWVKFSAIDLGTGFDTFTAMYAKDWPTTTYVEIRLDATDGTLIASLNTTNTGGWSVYQEASTSITGGTGVHDVYFVFTGGDGVGNFDWFKLSASGSSPSNNAPSVTLTNPADGATFTEGANISLTADASDSDGTISKVEFYEGTNKLGEDTDSPYSYDWTNVSAGSYSLTAKAIDDDAAETISSSVSITVEVASSSVDTIFSPVADAYVREHPNGQDVNYGFIDQLICQNQSGYSVQSYIKFDISSLASVGTATLKLYGYDDTGSQTVNLYDVSDQSWTEGGITWNNKPTASSTVTASQTVSTTAQWYNWDLTGYITDKINAGASEITLMAHNSNSDKDYFNSRENTSNQPELEILSGSLKSGEVVTQITASKNKGIFKVYPNPVANRQFTLEISGIENSARIQLINLQGQVLLEKEIQGMPGGVNTFPVQLNQNVEKGLYLISVQTKNNTRLVKINIL